MILTIERAALLRSLGHIQSVVERRNTIPILANVLLKASGGELSLAATDMDLEIVESVAADVRTPGATTTTAHTLYDIVRKLPDGAQIEMECTGDRSQLSLRAGRSHFRLGCLPADDFPQLSAGEFEHNFEISVSDLRQLIDRTRFAISTEETRYYLNGIYVHAATLRAGDADVPVLRAVATDGHRLARVELPLPEGAIGMPGVIIPRKAVNEVRKLIEDVADRITISLSDYKISLRFDQVAITSKLIDGTFPDYERVIPSGNDKAMDVPTKAFAAAVDRVATISTEKSRAVKLSLSPGLLVVSATSPDAGSASEELEVSYTENQVEIGFNSRYLLDIAQQVEGESIRFLMSDPAAPTVVRDSQDASALYVLMPMRV